MTSATPLPRRGLLKAGLVVSTALLTTAATSPAASATAASQRRGAEGELRELEQRYGLRLGVYARNVRTGQVVAHRAQERFAMCSTFKTVAAAAVLRDQARCAPLDKVIHYPPADILPHSPKTAQHVDTGMAVGDLCAAAIQYSDNAAGNLLLRQIGGPAGLTRFFRSIGDHVSRLDRWETDLNLAVPGDLRDTTTPEAIGGSYERLTVGRALADADRAQLVTWLKGNTTSGERFRAGLPKGWTVGDKTGTGDYASANDVGVAWTTRKTPIVLAVLTSKPTRDAPVDNAPIAAAARIVARTLAPGE
ncbi:beta-lactamase [Streptomyces albospinus]|uniref:Beta-lactamase n=1 Tax=Streptomyces albospinus TaxID=285515 RepID=A0ABQ2V3Z4_9ACTN|nr:class A beta-lactamase [Streptomyces albospinus]GGU64921.1 beta-lactamase [Streptomyces albospinus]